MGTRRTCLGRDRKVSNPTLFATPLQHLRKMRRPPVDTTSASLALPSPARLTGKCGTGGMGGDQMSKVREYRSRAESHAELARSAASTQDRKRHLRMQRSYELLARSAEFAHALDQAIEHFKR